MDQATARRRLIGLRDKHGANQADLSKAMGFNDRQTLSSIELGDRDIAPAELARAAHFFRVPVDYFTDPFELAGEARFSWRECAPRTDGLTAFETRAGRWIAAYRHLSRLRGDSINSTSIRVAITTKSSFEDASEQGDAVARALSLGDIPASTLANVIEAKLDTLVLMVDAVPGISGAACQLGALNTVLINRTEAEGRRSFDMAHELFHLLTWSDLPPPHIDGERGTPKAKRVELLADKFAGSLLMPTDAMRAHVARKPLPVVDQMPAWIRETATHFKVSGQALKWRLVDLDLLRRTDAERMDDQTLRIATPRNAERPPRFSKRFVDILGWGITQGHISVRKAADVAAMSIDDLADVFAEHGLETPFDL